nr:protein ALP1-like [Bactrocera oleae]
MKYFGPRLWSNKELWKSSNQKEQIHFHCGCKINTPKKDAISYYDRKGNFSITMQAICDRRFLDVFIGFPGSCYDANVWQNSPIYQKITSGEA